MNCTGHPWVQVDGVAPDKPLDSAVLSRLKQFSAMNKFKKMARRVSAIFFMSVLDLFQKQEIQLEWFKSGILTKHITFSWKKVYRV